MVQTSAAKAEVSVAVSGGEEDGAGEGEDALPCRASFSEDGAKQQAPVSVSLSSSAGRSDEEHRTGSMQYQSCSTGGADAAHGCCSLPSLPAGRADENKQLPVRALFVEGSCRDDGPASAKQTCSSLPIVNKAEKATGDREEAAPEGASSRGDSATPCWEFSSFCGQGVRTGGAGEGDPSAPSISFFSSVGLVGVSDSQQIPRSPTNSVCGGGSPAAAAVAAAAVCTPSTCASQSSPLSVVSSLRSTEPAEFSPQNSLAVPSSLSPLGGGVPVSTLQEGRGSSAVVLPPISDAVSDVHSPTGRGGGGGQAGTRSPHYVESEGKTGGEVEEGRRVWQGNSQESPSAKSYSSEEGEEQEVSKEEGGGSNPIARRRERKRRREEEEEEPQGGSSNLYYEPPCDASSSLLKPDCQNVSFSCRRSAAPAVLLPSSSSQASCAPFLLPEPCPPLSSFSSPQCASSLRSHETPASSSLAEVSSPSLVSTSSSASAVSAGGGGETLLSPDIPTASFSLKMKNMEDEEDSKGHQGEFLSSSSSQSKDANSTKLPVDDASTTQKEPPLSLHPPSTSCMRVGKGVISVSELPSSASLASPSEGSISVDQHHESSPSFSVAPLSMNNDDPCCSPPLGLSSSSRKHSTGAEGTSRGESPSGIASSSSAFPVQEVSPSRRGVALPSEARRKTSGGGGDTGAVVEKVKEEDSSSAQLTSAAGRPSLPTSSPSRLPPEKCPKSCSSDAAGASLLLPLPSSRIATAMLASSRTSSLSSSVSSRPSPPGSDEASRVASAALPSSSATASAPSDDQHDRQEAEGHHSASFRTNAVLPTLQSGNEDEGATEEIPLDPSDAALASLPASSSIVSFPSTPSSMPAITPPHSLSDLLQQETQVSDVNSLSPPEHTAGDDSSHSASRVERSVAMTPVTRRRASLSNPAVGGGPGHPSSGATGSSPATVATPSRRPQGAGGSDASGTCSTVLHAFSQHAGPPDFPATAAIVAEVSGEGSVRVVSPSSKKDAGGESGAASDYLGIQGGDPLWLVDKAVTPSRASAGEGEDREGRQRGGALEKRERGGSETRGVEGEEERRQNEDDEVTRLHRLDLLRHSHDRTTVELYKMEKGRLVEELVRKAKKYPKVPGVYFDRYQQRWCVNWTEAGRRVARYFPVKAHGFDFAYQLAVSCMLAKKPGSSSSAASASSPSSARSAKSRAAFVSSPFGAVARGLKAEAGVNCENPRGAAAVSSSIRKGTGTRRSTSLASSTTSRGSASQMVTSCSGVSSDTSTPSSSLTETGKLSSTSLHHPCTAAGALSIPSSLSGVSALTGGGGGPSGILALHQQMLLAAQQAAGRIDGGQMNSSAGGGAGSTPFPLSSLSAAMSNYDQALLCPAAGQGTTGGVGMDTQSTGLLAAFLRYQRAARLQQQQQLTAMLAGVGGVSPGEEGSPSAGSELRSGQSKGTLQTREDDDIGGGGLQALSSQQEGVLSSPGCSEAGRGSLLSSSTAADASAALIALLGGVHGNAPSQTMDPSPANMGGEGVLENAAAALLGPLGTELLVNTHPSLLLPSVTALARKLNQQEQQHLAASLSRGGGALADDGSAGRWSLAQDEASSRHVQSMLEDERVLLTGRMEAPDTRGVGHPMEDGRGGARQEECSPEQGENAQSSSTTTALPSGRAVAHPSSSVSDIAVKSALLLPSLTSAPSSRLDLEGSISSVTAHLPPDVGAERPRPRSGGATHTNSGALSGVGVLRSPVLENSASALSSARGQDRTDSSSALLVTQALTTPPDGPAVQEEKKPAGSRQRRKSQCDVMGSTTAISGTTGETTPTIRTPKRTGATRGNKTTTVRTALPHTNSATSAGVERDLVGGGGGAEGQTGGDSRAGVVVQGTTEDCARESVTKVEKLRDDLADVVVAEEEEEGVASYSPADRYQGQRRNAGVLPSEGEVVGKRFSRRSPEKKEPERIMPSSELFEAFSGTGGGSGGEAQQVLKTERCPDSASPDKSSGGRLRHLSRPATTRGDRTSSVEPVGAGGSCMCGGNGYEGHRADDPQTGEAAGEETPTLRAGQCRASGGFNRLLRENGEDFSTRGEFDKEGDDEDVHDLEADKAFANQPVKELVREAMRLKRVPGVWFDRSQLRWACNYRDTSSPASSSSTSSGDRSSPLPPAFSKRRAQYFPVKEHGFFRARQLAIQTRRRMNERSLSSSTAAGTTVFRSSSVPSNDPTVLTARTTGKNQPVAQTTPFRKNEKAEASASSPMKRTGGGRAARTPSASPQGDKPASGQTDRPGRQLTASSLGEEENTRAPCAAQWDISGGNALSALSTLALSAASLPVSALQGPNVINTDKQFLSSTTRPSPVIPTTTSGGVSLASVLAPASCGGPLDGAANPAGASLSAAAALLGRRLSALGETAASLPSSILEDLSLRLGGGGGGGVLGSGGELGSETAALAELLTSPLAASLMLTAAGGDNPLSSSLQEGGLRGATQAVEQRMDQRQQLLSSAGLATLPAPLDLLSSSSPHPLTTPLSAGVSGGGLLSPLLLALASPSSVLSPVAGSLSSCGGQLLALQKDAIQYILEDLRQNCLTSLSSLLPPAVFQSVSLHLMKHVQRVERAKVFTEVEPFLGLFLDCINSKQMPSQLPIGVQLNLIQLAVALDTLLDRAELVPSSASSNTEPRPSMLEGPHGGGGEAQAKHIGEVGSSLSPQKRRVRGDRHDISTLPIRVPGKNAEELENPQPSQLQQGEETQMPHRVLRPATPRRALEASKETPLLPGTLEDSLNSSWLALSSALPITLDVRGGTNHSGCAFNKPSGVAATSAVSTVGERGTAEPLSLFSSTLGGLLTGTAADAVAAPTSVPPSSV